MEKIYMNKTKKGNGVYLNVNGKYLLTSISNLKKFADTKQNFIVLSEIQDNKNLTPLKKVTKDMFSRGGK